MWEHYKRTFWGMQTVIFIVTIVVFAWSRLASLTGLFFLTMQFSSLLGAAWGKRLQHKFEMGNGQTQLSSHR